jgi:hypothetical protein
LADALLVGSAELVAVITTVPGNTPVTRPELLTFAFDTSLLDHVTVCETVEGSTVAVNCIVDPSTTVDAGDTTVTPVTAVAGGVTSVLVFSHAVNSPPIQMDATKRMRRRGLTMIDTLFGDHRFHRRRFAALGGHIERD